MNFNLRLLSDLFNDFKSIYVGSMYILMYKNEEEIKLKKHKTIGVY